MTDHQPQLPLTPQQRLETAAVILGLARPMLDDGAHSAPEHLRWLAGRLAESLTDVLAIAAAHLRGASGDVTVGARWHPGDHE
ncbi:hypothetical protein [Streptomyces sp. YKOK-I1]